MQRIHRIQAHLSTSKRSYQQEEEESKTIQQVVVIDAVRTPICRANKVLPSFLFRPSLSLLSLSLLLSTAFWLSRALLRFGHLKPCAFSTKEHAPCTLTIPLSPSFPHIFLPGPDSGSFADGCFHVFPLSISCLHSLLLQWIVV